MCSHMSKLINLYTLNMRSFFVYQLHLDIAVKKKKEEDNEEEEKE